MPLQMASLDHLVCGLLYNCLNDQTSLPHETKSNGRPVSTASKSLPELQMGITECYHIDLFHGQFDGTTDRSPGTKLSGHWTMATCSAGAKGNGFSE